MNDPVLMNEWLAAGWSTSIRQGELKAQQVLGREIVLWRNSTGIHAWEDLCVHRGTRLSMGQVKNDCLICPYHFWEYNASGQCVRIPAQPTLAPPAKARANVFHVREKYGLIWVCLGNPQGEIPAFDDGDRESFRKIPTGPYRFRANGPRIIENFLDVAHLPFVHAGLLGDPTMPEIDDYEAQTTADGIVARDIRVWQPNPDGTGRPGQVLYTYSVVTPLTATFTKAQGERRFSMLCTVTPVAPCESLSWIVEAMNYAHDVPEEELRSFQDRINAQDIPIVESQRPELLPLDLQAELHIRSDRMAIAYRRWLKERGLRYGTA